MKTYLLKIATKHTMASLLAVLEDHGTILSIQEAKADGQQQAELPKPKKLNLSPEERQARSDRIVAFMNKENERIDAVLFPILRDNQYAPLSVIVSKLNATGTVNWKGHTFTETNIKKYVNFSLEKATSPAEVKKAAAQAMLDGKFEALIAPVTVPGKKETK